MGCFNLKIPKLFRKSGDFRRQRHNLPVPERIVPRGPPPSPREVIKPPPSLLRQLFRGERPKVEPWQLLDVALQTLDMIYWVDRVRQLDLGFEELLGRQMVSLAIDPMPVWDPAKEKETAATRIHDFFYRKDRKRRVERYKKMMRELQEIEWLLIEFGKLDAQRAREYTIAIRDWADNLRITEGPVKIGKTWTDDPDDRAFYEWLATQEAWARAKVLVKKLKRPAALTTEIPVPGQSSSADPLEGPSWMLAPLSPLPLDGSVYSSQELEIQMEPEEPLSPEQIELERVQRNRYHSELDQEARDEWKIAKWHYEQRTEHETAHYQEDHELPSRPGQFELEETARAYGVPLPGTPIFADELASTTSSMIRSAIAAEHRADRMANKREGLPDHLKDFDPFAEDTRPKIPTVVASAPVTVQKPFPTQIEHDIVQILDDMIEIVLAAASQEPESVENKVDPVNAHKPRIVGAILKKGVVAADLTGLDDLEWVEYAEDLQDDGAVPILESVEKAEIEPSQEAAGEDDDDDDSISEADLAIDVDDLLELALSQLDASSKIDEQLAAGLDSKVEGEPQTVEEEPQVQTLKVVFVQVEPPAEPANVIVVKADVHPGPKQDDDDDDDEIPPPLPEKKNKRNRNRTMVHYGEDKIEVDRSFIDPPKVVDADPPAGESSFAPACFHNISWNFFTPLRPPKNPPGMVKVKFDDLGEF